MTSTLREAVNETFEDLMDHVDDLQADLEAGCNVARELGYLMEKLDRERRALNKKLDA